MSYDKDELMMKYFLCFYFSMQCFNFIVILYDAPPVMSNYVATMTKWINFVVRVHGELNGRDCGILIEW